MNVIHVITDTNIGGAGRWLLEFIDNYDRNIINMEVVLPFNSLLKPEIVKRGVPVTEAARLAERSFDAAAAGGLLAIFRLKRPDIAHTHAAMSARLAARLCGGCKIVHTRHSVFKPRVITTVFPFKQAFGLVNNAFSDKIVAVSPAAASNMTRTGVNPAKIEVVYNGVSPVKRLNDEEKRRARERFGLTDSSFAVALIARLTSVKGHGYALDAAKIIAKSAPDVRIIFAGDGENENALRRRIERENITNVVMTGFLPDVHILENVIDLQINASYGTEATSLSLLEGMSLGVPAVVSDFGGNPYVIKDGYNGIVVRQKDAAALAEAILRLKNEKTFYQKTRENAAREYSEKFTAKEMTRRISDIYTRLTEGGERGKR